MVSAILIGIFQNCAPAKLVGSVEGVAELNSTSNSTVGTKVNLELLSAAPPETASNILFPNIGNARTSPYGPGMQIFENMVIRSNDFSRIEWIQESTSTVISNGDVLAE